MFPLCGENSWDCARSIVIGGIAFSTTLMGCFAIAKILRPWLRTRFHSIELLMITLSTTQTLLSMLYFLVVEESRLEYGIKYLRAVQNTLTALNYGIVAMDIFGRRELVKRLLFPSTAVILLGFTILFIVACAVFELDCAHPSWLAMSIVSLIVSLSFTIVGFFVLKKLMKKRDAASAEAHEPYNPPSYTGSKIEGLEDPSELESSAGATARWLPVPQAPKDQEGALVRQKRYQLFVLITVSSSHRGSCPEPSPLLLLGERHCFNFTVGA